MVALRHRARLGGPRFVAGVLCVVATAAVLVLHVPDTFSWTDSTVHDNAWRSPLRRLVHTGDVNDIPHDFQEAAMTYVPTGSTFAVLPPPSPEIAQSGYGIPPVALVELPYYMQFLLLPSRMVDPSVAQYVLCFACDTDRWDKHTTWLWRNTAGESVGKVDRR
jgi:hypothetical protein